MMAASTPRIIDPEGLTVAQLAGERCAVPNCRRLLGDDKVLLGPTPDGTPIFICNDHDLSEVAA